LHGLSEHEINAMAPVEWVELLRQKLKLCEIIKAYRDALLIDEDALLDHMLDAGQTTEKLLKLLLLSALYSNIYWHREIIKEIKEVVSNIVIGRSEIQGIQVAGASQ
jgi:hypothetical protein